MPWIIEQAVELSIGIGLFLIYAIAGYSYSFAHILFFIISVIIASYFTYAVLSHYILLRNMDKHADQIIQSVMDSKFYPIISINMSMLSFFGQKKV